MLKRPDQLGSGRAGFGTAGPGSGPTPNAPAATASSSGNEDWISMVKRVGVFVGFSTVQIFTIVPGHHSQYQGSSCSDKANMARVAAVMLVGLGMSTVL